MSSQGAITADIIKNAMFSASDEINKRFEQMPMTWAQIWNKMKNIAIKTFRPVLDKINELANNEQIQNALQSFVYIISTTAYGLVSFVEKMIQLIDILKPFAPLLLGIIGAYVVWNIVSAITTFLLGLQTIAQFALAVATKTKAGADVMATASQLGLNTAMLACPAFWLMIVIFALIAVLTYLWFTNDDVAYGMLYAWDMLRLGALALKIGAQEAFYGIVLVALYMLRGILGVKEGLITAFYGIKLQVQALKLAFLASFETIANAAIDMYNAVAEVLNKLGGDFGTFDHVDFTSKAIDDMYGVIADYAKAMAKTNEQVEAVQSAIDKTQGKIVEIAVNGTNEFQSKADEYDATRNDRVSNRNNWIGEVKDKISEALNTDFPIDWGDLSSEAAGIGDNTGKTAKDAANTAANTANIADSMSETQEDLKYLRDLAEQEVVNRFTTAEIKIDMTNHNSINSDMDLDGVVNILEDKLGQAMEVAAEGYHF